MTESRVHHEQDIVFMSVKLYKLFMAYGREGHQAKELLLHYIFTARWQGTNSVRADDVYCKNGLFWGSKKLKDAKALLHKLGLIEYKQMKNEVGQFEHRYIIVKPLTHTGGSVFGLPGNPDHQSEETNASLNNRSASLKKESAYNTSFLRFWNEYPRRIAKKAAYKSWSKINPDEELVEVIIESVKQHKTSKKWQDDNGEYIPHPTTYLNQGRWEDELAESEDSFSGRRRRR